MLSRPLAPNPPVDNNNNGDGSSENSPSTPQLISKRVLKACTSCRQLKRKCNGTRPKCHNCTRKNLECVYTGSARTRLQALEAVVRVLENRPDLHAEDLVRTIGSRPGALRPADAVAPAAPLTHSVACWPTSMPSPSITTRAIDGFFGCSGKLFHVFSRQQVTGFYQKLFQGESGDQMDDEKKAAAGCISAVAAVGCQYVAGAFDPTIEKQFYESARYCFEAILELQPLDSVKICTLLSMFNIMNKATVALAYVEIGLSVARRLRLDIRAYRDPAIDPRDWIDYRRAWRTLMFFSSWLASTLGYISGNDLTSQTVPLAEMDIADPADISEVVQSEMAKIAILKAEILRVHLAFRDITIPVVASVLEHLQQWHEHLPAGLHLRKLREERGTYETDVRRCIYHVHLLYQGAIILLHRRVASQFLRQYTLSEEVTRLPNPLNSVVDDVAEQGILAAKRTASIVKLLHDENGVYKRCWLVIFQSYASCIIILHSVAQKQLFGFDRLSWADDLDYASRSLAALRFCSEVDPVAAKFANKLTPLYDILESQSNSGQSEIGTTRENELASASSGSHRATREPEANDKPAAGYLFRLPEHQSTERVSVSFALLELLCRPFGDPDTLDAAKIDVKLGETVDPTRAEHAQMIERLELDFETTTPFHWDSRIVQSRGLEQKIQTGNCFLDGLGPNGWSSEPDNMERDPE